MVEIGVVNQHINEKVVVDFQHLNTSTECDVLQATTGTNTTFILPTLGSQVVCWVEGGKNIVLGSLFSNAEPPPKEKTDMFIKCGDLQCSINENKLELKNSLTDLKTVLTDILDLIKGITVSTPTGPSGTPLPPTILSAEQCSLKINNILK